MDIHKPKPWHGAREFLKEYLIIVVGVLTALAAEAVVQGLHENRLAAEARDSIRAEINLDLAVAGKRAQQQPCIDARFAEIGGVLSAIDDGKPFRTLAYLGSPRRLTIYTQRWDAAMAGGRISLFPTDEQKDLARVHKWLRLIAERANDETAAWARMRAIEGVKHPSAETAALVRQALSEARSDDYDLRIAAAGARDYGRRIGIKGDAQIVDLNKRVDATCVPSTTNRDDVAALTGDRTGAP